MKIQYTFPNEMQAHSCHSSVEVRLSALQEILESAFDGCFIVFKLRKCATKNRLMNESSAIARVLQLEILPYLLHSSIIFIRHLVKCSPLFFNFWAISTGLLWIFRRKSVSSSHWCLYILINMDYFFFFKLHGYAWDFTKSYMQQSDVRKACNRKHIQYSYTDNIRYRFSQRNSLAVITKIIQVRRMH